VTGWVFDNGSGERLHVESFRHRFERAMQDAGVPRLTPHGLRHTGATALARAGVSPKTLAARLGHSSVSVTFDLNAHALVEDQRDAAEAFATRLDATA
jgi:integrase